MHLALFLSDSSAPLILTVLCLLALGGVAFASYTGESEHDADDEH